MLSIGQNDVKQTLAEMGVPRSTFYRWYEQYQRAGVAGLQDRSSQPRQFWNRIPDTVRDQVVQIARQNQKLTAQRAGHPHFTDAISLSKSDCATHVILANLTVKIAKLPVKFTREHHFM